MVYSKAPNTEYTKVQLLNFIYLYLPLFIPSFIFCISANPLSLRWPFSFTISAIRIKSLRRKSSNLQPTILYCWKKGIIIDWTSINLCTLKVAQRPLELNFPQPKKGINPFNNCSSLLCWLTLNSNTTWKPVL